MRWTGLSFFVYFSNYLFFIWSRYINIIKSSSFWSCKKYRNKVSSFLVGVIFFVTAIRMGKKWAKYDIGFVWGVNSEKHIECILYIVKICIWYRGLNIWEHMAIGYCVELLSYLVQALCVCGWVFFTETCIGILRIDLYYLIISTPSSFDHWSGF